MKLYATHMIQAHQKLVLVNFTQILIRLPPIYRQGGHFGFFFLRSGISELYYINIQNWLEFANLEFKFFFNIHNI